MCPVDVCWLNKQMKNSELTLGLRVPNKLSTVPVKLRQEYSEVRSRIHMVGFLGSSVGTIFLLSKYFIPIY